MRDIAQKRAAAEQSRTTADQQREAFLHASADEAEAYAAAAEVQIRALRFYESRTEADWATQTPEQQEQLRTLIDRLRAALPKLLAALPIEKRRELEQEE